MHQEPEEGVSTCRSKSPKGELLERTHDYVTASRSLRGEIKNTEVVDDFESRPHKAVSFIVERDKEVQVWSQQKMPEAPPGFSGGTLPGRSKGEEGGEEEDEEEENQERKMRKEVTRGIIAGVLKEADTVGSGVTTNTVSVTQSINVKEDSIKHAELGVERKDERKGIEQRVRQTWECSHIEDSLGEGDVTDWCEDDEMMRRWEEVSKEEGSIVQKENGRRMGVCKECQSLCLLKMLTKGKRAQEKGREKGKVVVH